MNLLFFGAGAVNLSLIGWLGQKGIQSTLLARGSSHEFLSQNDLKWSMANGGPTGLARPTVISSLYQCPRPDAVVIGTKAYHLEAVCQHVSEVYGRNMPVLALQNGVEHLPVLLNYFDRVVLASVWYNSHRPTVGQVVAVNHGPISLAAANPTSEEILNKLAVHFTSALPVVVAPSARDMLLCKLVVNLTNSAVSLTGANQNSTQKDHSLQKLVSAMLFEGVKVLKKIGVKEIAVPGAPKWWLMQLNYTLPAWATSPIFKIKMAKMSISSMAQDLVSHPELTEIEEINGAFVRLAQAHRVPVPVNERVLEMCRQRFGQSFRPMPAAEVWRAASTAL